MIEFKKYTLDNGLRLIIHQDIATPMVAVNVVYDVGSRDEMSERTGFAHLFEHLMFAGSENVTDFDIPIQKAGGENNAFTNSDMTSFYSVVPAENIETVLWLESDRMKSLTISQKSLDVQKKVVVEEFKETCLNEPYGDLMHHMLDLAYEDHNYRWPTIGIKPEHISEAKIEEVTQFYNKHYQPSNAIVVVAGNIETEKAKDLVSKWFGEINSRAKPHRILKQEKKQSIHKFKVTNSSVPLPAIYRGYHMVGRMHPDYYACDLLSDALGSGRSSRLYQRLHKNQKIFSVIDAYIMGSFDPGLFMLEGQPLPDISIEQSRDAIIRELEEMKFTLIPENELQKIKNKVESSLEYAEVNILHKAQSLAYFELLGDANLANKEGAAYQAITSEDIMRVANDIFIEENCCEVIYEA